MDAVSRRLNFDPLARPYRWLEYLTFGRALERCRFHFLSELQDARNALVFGDGDGRFLVKLLEMNPNLHADVIDISPAMLEMLMKKLDPADRQRVSVHPSDARQFEPTGRYDLVVTHFFLDCLYEKEVLLLVDRVRPSLMPQAAWLVSEFAIPSGTISSWMGSSFISALYLAFRVITGLPVSQLPDYSSILRAKDFFLLRHRKWLSGLLVSELWQLSPPPGATGMHPNGSKLSG
jgi:SAM-dependent methyltransferase